MNGHIGLAIYEHSWLGTAAGPEPMSRYYVAKSEISLLQESFQCSFTTYTIAVGSIRTYFRVVMVGISHWCILRLELFRTLIRLILIPTLTYTK